MCYVTRTLFKTESYNKEVYIVAIDNLGEDREGIARALSEALEMTFYDALVRVRVPGKGPLIVAAYKEKNTALERAEKLGAAGFRTLVLGHDEVETDEMRIIIRKFFFGDSELEVEARTGNTVRIEYALIDMIIRGTRIVQNTETETVKDRKFDVGRTILSGGLDSLGPALQLTRAANFAFVLAELRRRCPRAVYDDRLVSKAGQSRLLGSMFEPERHLDIAVSLLSRSLRF